MEFQRSIAKGRCSTGLAFQVSKPDRAERTLMGETESRLFWRPFLPLLHFLSLATRHWPPCIIMESPTSRGSERKKLLRSCDACRTSKTRCLPEGDNDDLCQRYERLSLPTLLWSFLAADRYLSTIDSCRRLGKQCIFSEARGRAKGQKRFPHSYGQPAQFPAAKMEH